jgi:nucleotide-binding universal stress UspA family protein
VTIAVAQDDSPEGEAALLHAAREASWQRARLAVLHVLDFGQPDTEQHQDALSREIQHRLVTAGFGPLDWSLFTATDEDGRAAALVALTEKVGADLLVIGSRRRTPIGKFLLGSTVQRVVLDAPVPVLVVKAALRSDEPVSNPVGR